jgi:hypothetical protein
MNECADLWEAEWNEWVESLESHELEAENEV